MMENKHIFGKMVEEICDCYGTCYQIWNRNGGHLVERVEGDEEHEFREVVFLGDYEKCHAFISDAKLKAALSLYS